MTSSTGELLIEACLCSDGEFGNAVSAFDAYGSLDDLDEGTLRLASYLYRRLERCSVTSKNQNILKGIYTRYWYLYITRNRPSLDSVVSTLGSTGFLVLKAVALRELVYHSDPATRPGSDVDLLLRPEDREEVIQRFFDSGFSTAPGTTGAANLSNRFSVSLVRDQEEIDLHWGLYPTRKQATLIEDVFTGKMSVSIHGHRVNTLNAAQHLVHNLMHGAGQNEVSPVRWIVDCALLIQSTELDWKEVVIWADRWGWVRPVLNQLLRLRERHRVEIPDFVFDQLRAAQSPPWMSLLQFHRHLRPGILRKVLSVSLVQPLAYRTIHRVELPIALFQSLRQWAKGPLPHQV